MTNIEYAETTKTYKRKVAGSFMLVDGAKLNEKISGEDFCVTKKIDGTMQILFYENGEVCAVSTTGKIRRGLPCLEEFAALSKRYGAKTLTVAAELYAVIREDGRERVCDVSTAEADESLRGKLKLAVFDILDIDGELIVVEHYKDKLAKIESIFSGNLVHPVESKAASSKQEVERIFQQWVIDGGAEGIVLHSEIPIVYKIKPRHTIDAAIIGYTVGEENSNHAIRDILVAVMREDGLFQQFAATGNGFSSEQKSKLFERLSTINVESSYIETDSRNVAFHMVKPEVIVELSVVDLVSENSAGEAKMNTLLEYDEDKGYTSLGSTPGVAAHSLIFTALRDDKSANTTDIRISQLTDLCEFSEQKAITLSNLPASEIVARRVFTKGEGAKQMVQKFMVWKTNKDANPLFPAFVFHYTDFSISRKEQLKRDLRVSDSREQIMRILDEFIAENVKKGWVEI